MAAMCFVGVVIIFLILMAVLPNRKNVQSLPYADKLPLPIPKSYSSASGPEKDFIGPASVPNFNPEITSDSDRLDGLLTLLSESEQVWLVGGQGTGKSTLLAHLADEYASREMILIIDSHNEPGKWPNAKNIKVIGTGKNYAEIASGMKYITEQIQTRIEKLGSGEKKQNEFYPIRVMIDEYTMIPMQLEELMGKKPGQEFMKKFRNTMFTEGRKIRIFPCFATHSKRASATGFSGAVDMFEMINHKIFLKNVNGDRFAEIQFADEKQTVKYAVPGVHPRLEGIKSGSGIKKIAAPEGWSNITPERSAVKKKTTKRIFDPTIGGMGCGRQSSAGLITGVKGAASRKI